jgi:hypothetical protein
MAKEDENRQAKEDGDLLSRARETFRSLSKSFDLEGRVARNPFGMLAAAALVGYVLAGGFPTRLTRRILGLGIRMGIRMLAIPAMERELVELSEFMGDGRFRGDADVESEPH